MTPAQEITRAFNGDWRGQQGFIPTPGHSERDRGTTVRDGDDGGVIFHSFNGGDWRALQDECRRRGLLPEKLREDAAQRWRVTGIYEFRDAEGAVLYRTRRMEHPAKSKRFEAQRPDGKGGWVDKLGDCPRVLYRLPELMASDPAEPVYFVEGERKADKLASWGMVATSIAFGAKGWRKSYADALADRIVIFLPDNDQPGHEFADKAKLDMQEAGAVVHIIDLPGLVSKGDIIDWTGTPEELRDLVHAVLHPPAKLLPLLDPSTWQEMETPRREWALEGWIPQRQATYLTGSGSAGKSLLTQQLCTCLSIGAPFLGINVAPVPAIYLTCEDDADELHRRQKAICAAIGVPLAALRGKLHLVSLSGAIGNELATFTPEGKMSVAENFQTVLASAHATGTRLIVLDNVAHLFAGNENIRNQVAAFVGLLNQLAAAINGAVLLLGHPNKAGQDFSGSTAWENQVRSRLFMETPRDNDGSVSDPDARVLSRGKANYARNGERLSFRWHEWAFVRDEDLPPSMAAELASTAAATGDNAIFLSCLDARTRGGLIASPNISPNYAPTQFEPMPAAKGIGKVRLRKAMERLLALCEIEVYDHQNTGKGRVVKALRRASLTTPNDSPDVSRTASRTVPEPRPDVARTTPHIHPSPKGEEGAAIQAAAPSRIDPDHPDAPDTNPGWDDDRYPGGRHD